MRHTHDHDHERRHRRAFGFGGPWEGRGRQHPGRGRRGNTRAAILALLSERAMHGYEMISELEQRTGGVWRPSPGSIYPTLQMLEEEGLIVAEVPGEGGKRRYTLTDKGREHSEQAERPWRGLDKGRIAEAQQFREAGAGIMHALRQVGMTGTEDQRQRAIEVLNDTKRKLYAILAE